MNDQNNSFCGRMNYNFLEIEMLCSLSQELSPREWLVFQYLQAGKEIRDIEKRLGISMRTVYRDRDNILSKIRELLKLRVF